MDSTAATNPTQARRRLVCVENAFSQLLATTVILPFAYLLLGWRVAAAAAAVILLGCLFTPTGSNFIRTVLCCRRPPGLAASGVVGGGGMGTDAAAIAALPAAFAFKRDVLAGDGWAQCAICLGLVLLGEKVRRLPACGHMFHAGCVDEWLRAHPTCPLCRAAVRRPQRLPV
nr:E3 ubiquitin-protein ligase EL5-like [Lolium perenne]